MRASPSFPTRIRSRNVRLSDRMRQSIEGEAAALRRFNSRIVDCEVTVTGPGPRHSKARAFDVVVKVALPGPDVVVHRTAAASVPVAINESFAVTRRRVKRQAELRRRPAPWRRTSDLGRRGRPSLRSGSRRRRRH